METSSRRLLNYAKTNVKIKFNRTLNVLLPNWKALNTFSVHLFEFGVLNIDWPGIIDYITFSCNVGLFYNNRLDYCFHAFYEVIFVLKSSG